MLSPSDIILYPLDSKFDLTEFKNENSKFVRYLCKYASRDDKANIGRVFLFIHKTERKIVGYVTIAMAHVPREGHKKLTGLTGYTNIPALLLGQMARNLDYNHMGAGRFMLDWVINHGIELSKKVGCRVIILNSVPEKVDWYKSNNFVLLEKPDNTLFLDLFRGT